MVAAFRERRLDHTEFPYVFLDATYVKAHEGAHAAIVSSPSPSACTTSTPSTSASSAPARARPSSTTVTGGSSRPAVTVARTRSAKRRVAAGRSRLGRMLNERLPPPQSRRERRAAELAAAKRSRLANAARGIQPHKGRHAQQERAP